MMTDNLVPFAPYMSMSTCPNGHVYPSAAGACPDELMVPPLPTKKVLAGLSAPGAGAVNATLSAFFNQIVKNVDNGKAPRWGHAFGWENRKIGIVNHIPVCDTLEQLTAYFNGGTAQGSTHFGVGRPTAFSITASGLIIPFAQVHQYMPVVGPQAPWAQGVIQTSPNCAIPPSKTIAGMRSGEPNGAFVSVENVARTGSQGVTDAQFNANVVLRAYWASFFNHDITPLTQLWHAEIDQKDRCFDPGWDGDLEDDMQFAAQKLMVGNLEGLRGAQAVPVPPTPTPTPIVLSPEEFKYGLIELIVNGDYVKAAAVLNKLLTEAGG